MQNARKRGRGKGHPGYLRHRDPTRGDRAFVILNGKRIYLGAYGSPESARSPKHETRR